MVDARKVTNSQAGAGARPRGPWTAAEIARNKRADQARIAHDRARGVGANLEAAIERTRGVLTHLAPGRSLVDEMIAERREDHVQRRRPHASGRAAASAPVNSTVLALGRHA